MVFKRIISQILSANVIFQIREANLMFVKIIIIWPIKVTIYQKVFDNSVVKQLHPKKTFQILSKLMK